MRYAVRMAQRAEQQGEVPVGAIVVKDDQCVAEGWNSSIAQHDATAHAEIMALRKAGVALQNYRLVAATLYVTLEPCVMCMGAIIQARIDRLVFGAHDPKAGAVESCYHIGSDALLNHTITIESGILAEECGAILKDFFRGKRRK